jgi:spore maturation protein SpmB
MSPDPDNAAGPPPAAADPPPAAADPPPAADSTSTGRRDRVHRDLVLGLRTGIGTFWQLVRFMVPAYGAALVLEYFGVIEALGRAAAPLMSLLGLPGEAAVPLVVGYVLNIYAAIGAMQAIALSPTQITVLAIAILIGHNLLIEGAVLYRAGMNGLAFGVMRALAGLAAAAVANLLMGVF